MIKCENILLVFREQENKNGIFNNISLTIVIPQIFVHFPGS